MKLINNIKHLTKKISSFHFSFFTKKNIIYTFVRNFSIQFFSANSCLFHVSDYVFEIRCEELFLLKLCSVFIYTFIRIFLGPFCMSFHVCFISVIIYLKHEVRNQFFYDYFLFLVTDLLEISWDYFTSVTFQYLYI